MKKQKALHKDAISMIENIEILEEEKQNMINSMPGVKKKFPDLVKGYEKDIEETGEKINNLKLEYMNHVQSIKNIIQNG